MFDLNKRNFVEILTSPKLEQYKVEIQNALIGTDLKDHIVILSSGTTSSQIKGYALSREALISNARAVNNHFSLSSADIWGLSLPPYHVGGLSVLVRAALLNNKVVLFGKWDPKEWTLTIQNEAITITTVVPTQVFDLVINQIEAPKSLKYLVVGGDFLSSELEKRALSLGWPVIRTFGMTEVCSQLASGRRPGDKLQVLPIHHIKAGSDQRLLVKSEALFKLQFTLGESPKIQLASELLDNSGYYPCMDRVEIEGNTLVPIGRIDDQVKISGRLVSLLTLKDTLATFALEKKIYGKVEVDIVQDERKGKCLRLLYVREAHSQLESLQELFSPLKIDIFQEVDNFERTDLGKLKRHQ